MWCYKQCCMAALLHAVEPCPSAASRETSGNQALAQAWPQRERPCLCPCSHPTEADAYYNLTGCPWLMMPLMVLQCLLRLSQVEMALCTAKVQVASRA